MEVKQTLLCTNRIYNINKYKKDTLRGIKIHIYPKRTKEKNPSFPVILLVSHVSVQNIYTKGKEQKTVVKNSQSSG